MRKTRLVDCNPQWVSYASIAAGCMPEHVTETMFCALHIFIRDGQIEFCGDSK